MAKKHEFQKNKNIPTSQAIDRLADEWIGRAPVPGVTRKEIKFIGRESRYKDKAGKVFNHLLKNLNPK